MSIEEMTKANPTKKAIVPIVLCWVLIGLIFFTFTMLPTVKREGATLVRAFYALCLCHPYFRTLQFYSNKAKFFETNLPLAEYQKNHMVLEYYFGNAVYVLIGIVVMFLALGNAFGRIALYDYLAVGVYGIALLLLEMGIGNRD